MHFILNITYYTRCNNVYMFQNLFIALDHFDSVS